MLNENNINYLLEILDKMSKTNDEKIFVYETLKNLEIFNIFNNITESEINKDDVIKILNSIKYLKLDKNQVIFFFGDVSDERVYIILEGVVSVLKPQKINFNFRDIIKYYKNNKYMLKFMSGSNNYNENLIKRIIFELKLFGINNLNKSQISLLLSKFIIDTSIKLKDLKQGKLFGEKSLLYDKNRSASTYCQQDTILLYLEKDNFIKIYSYIRKIKNQKVEFLDNLFYYAKINFVNDQLKKKRYNQFKLKNISKDYKIIRENEEGNKIYILYKGIAKIFYKNKEICILNDSGFFGEELLNNKTYITTVISQTQDLLCYEISKEKLLFYPDSVINYLKENIIKKSKLRNNLLKNTIKIKNKIKNKSNLKTIQIDLNNMFYSKIISKKRSNIIKFKKRSKNFEYNSINIISNNLIKRKKNHMIEGKICDSYSFIKNKLKSMEKNKINNSIKKIPNNDFNLFFHKINYKNTLKLNKSHNNKMYNKSTNEIFIKKNIYKI